MSDKKVITLWENKGNAFMTGWDLSAKNYLKRSATGPGADVFETGGANSWHPINCEGAAECILEWNCELVEAGGLDTELPNGSGNTRITAVGTCGDVTPSIVAGTPAAAIGNRDLFAMSLTVRPSDPREATIQWPDDAVSVLGDVGIFYDGLVLADGVKSNWQLELSKRLLLGNQTAGAEPTWLTFPTPDFSIRGLGKIWVNPALVSSFDAPPADQATSRVAASLKAHLHYD